MVRARADRTRSAPARQREGDRFVLWGPTNQPTVIGPMICPRANAEVMAAIKTAELFGPEIERASCIAAIGTTMNVPPTSRAAIRIAKRLGKSADRSIPIAIIKWAPIQMAR